MKYTTTDVPDYFPELLRLLPYLEQIKNAIAQMEKCTNAKEFVIFVPATLYKGGFQLCGCDVIAHYALKDDTIVIVKKSELELLFEI